MSVTSVGATTDTTTTSGTTSKDSSSIFSSQLDGNAFLTLFLKQLQYQDPTNPMESYELASQLAQFSSVEKLANIGTSLTALQSSLTSLTNAQMINLIGKEVVAQSNALQVTNGTATDATYSFSPSSGSTANLTITISDANGQVVRTKTLSSQAAGEYQLNWDGLNDSGSKVSDGTYTFAIKAFDTGGNSVDVTSTVSGTAYSYRLDSNIPYLVLDGPDGVKVSASNVKEITQAASSS